MKRSNAMPLCLAGSLFMAQPLAFAGGDGDPHEPRPGLSVAVENQVTPFYADVLDYDWTVEYSALDPEITLPPGETRDVTFLAELTRLDARRLDFPWEGIRGEVCITNHGDSPVSIKRIDADLELDQSDGWVAFESATPLVPSQKLYPGQTRCHDYAIRELLNDTSTYRGAAHVAIQDTKSDRRTEVKASSTTFSPPIPSGEDVLMDGYAWIGAQAECTAGLRCSPLKPLGDGKNVTESGSIEMRIRVTNEAIPCEGSGVVRNGFSIVESKKRAGIHKSTVIRAGACR